MHRKGDFAITAHGGGDIDKTIAYYRGRLEEMKTPDKKMAHFENMIAVLEKRKQQRVSRDLIHAKSSMMPSWGNPNKRAINWRFRDHVMVFSQRPRGTRGPPYESQLLTVAIPHDPRTEEESKDRARLELELKDAAASEDVSFRVAICGRKVHYKTYDGSPNFDARMYVLVGTDVNIAFVEKDLSSIVRLYNKCEFGPRVSLI